MENLHKRSDDRLAIPQVDLSTLSQREKELVSEAKRLAHDVEDKEEDILAHYFKLGKIVDSIHNPLWSYRKLADAINVRGFSYSTLNYSYLFYNDVQKIFRGSLDAFIIAMGKDPKFGPTEENPQGHSISWRNVIHYLSRDRTASSEGERRTDKQFAQKEAIKPFRKFEDLSNKLLRDWDDMSPNVKELARGYLKRVRMDLSNILSLE